VLGAAEVGVLASVGKARVRVHRRPVVAVLATGDELLGVDEKLVRGKIRSTNDYSLAGQVREAGCEALLLGIARDDAADLAARIGRAQGADVLLTSGGVSVGDHDEVQEVLVREGFRKIFWRVASSPGKPLLFGTLGAAHVFGLPGNPVSSMVAFENFVRPFLRMLQGDRSPDRPKVSARAADEIKGPDSRRHFARVRVSYGSAGYVAREVRPHGSGNLRSMVNANGLAVVPEGSARIPEGGSVEVILLRNPDRE
jgi:molybdopterin molybdotransferase